MRRATRAFELLVAALSIGVVVAAAALVRADHAAAGAVLVGALALSAAPFVVVVLASAPLPPASSADAPALTTEGAVTTVIRVGGEPHDLVLACAALATRAGPTVLVTAGRIDIDDVVRVLGIPLVRDRSIEEALGLAAWLVDTDAVLVVHPGAVPLPDGCARAAARLADGVGWVIGGVREFDDGYAPEGREVLGERLRARARRRGLTAWERDATIVRTSLLRTHALAPRRPWGSWLRSVREHGFVGVEEPSAVAVRAAPAGAGTFWPATVSRQRATAADLADALTWKGGRTLAAGLLLRELYAYPLAVLLATPIVAGLTGSFPFRVAVAPLVATVLAAGAARWLAFRVGQGLRPRPLRDAVAAAYAAPGSFRALFAACSRRLSPTRFRVSQRTLAWATVAAAAAAVVPLLDRRSGDPDLEFMAGVAVWVLVLLWLFTVRLVAARHWDRATPRIPVRVPVLVDGASGHTIDVAPGGLAVVLDGDVPQLGDSVTVAVETPEASFTGPAHVADRRDVGGRPVVGLALDPDPASRARWARVAFAASTAGADLTASGRSSGTEVEVRARPGRAVRVLDRIALTLAAALAAIAISALALSAAGYRPLVMRSDSMRPTLRTGDLIVVDDVRADAVRVGDIVTYTAADGEDVTHRVRAIERHGEHLRFETEGDASSTQESWSRRADDTLGRYELRIPGFGTFVARLRGRHAVWALIGLAVVLALASVGRSAVVERTRHGPGGARAA